MQGLEDMAHQQRLMQSLEARDLLDRVVENLPDDMAIAERIQKNEPLTRAEIGVILAYPKIVALDDLIESDVPDDPYFEADLFRYFPTAMQKNFADEIRNHRLRREIIGTLLANSMINRGGPTFVSRLQNRTGADTDQIARAYTTVREAFRLQKVLGAIDALDNKISGALQLQLYAMIRDRVIDQSVWFARYGDFAKGIGPVVNDYQAAVDHLMPRLPKIVPDFLQNRIEAETNRLVRESVPKELASTLAKLPIASLIPDILLCANQTGKKLDKAADVFFAITNAFEIGRIVQAASSIEAEDFYDDLALDRALQSLHSARRAITIDVLTKSGDPEKWLKSRASAVESTRNQMRGIVDHDQATVSRLTVAANILGDLMRSG